jgi:hypothetical protein
MLLNSWLDASGVAMNNPVVPASNCGRRFGGEHSVEMSGSTCPMEIGNAHNPVRAPGDGTNSFRKATNNKTELSFFLSPSFRDVRLPMSPVQRDNRDIKAISQRDRNIASLLIVLASPQATHCIQGTDNRINEKTIVSGHEIRDDRRSEGLSRSVTYKQDRHGDIHKI